MWSQDGHESRFVDAVALNLFAGEWHAFEVKASRADLQHDLGEARKSAWVRARVDFFWLVEARPGIVHLKEIPERWGVLTLRDGKLEAPQTAQRIGGTPDRALFLGFTKRVVAGPRGDALKAAREAAFGEGVAKGKEDYDYSLERATVKAQRLERLLSKRARKDGASP